MGLVDGGGISQGMVRKSFDCFERATGELKCDMLLRCKLVLFA